jgi:hypothetical protein
MRDRNPFVSISSEGGLLPIPMLERVASEVGSIPGGRPEDYELLPGKRLREIINRSWNDLLGAWAAYKTKLSSLAKDDPAVGLTREAWLLPLLRELGWAGLEARGSIKVGPAQEQSQKDWAISHEWGGMVPLHLLGANVPLDSRTAGVPGAASMAPHSLVQDFLNSTESHLWGIVSNGLRLRLLRDSTSLTRQAYVEFDLETMFENEIFSDFTVLWLTCHRTRFDADFPQNSFVERWQGESHEQGVRALDALSAGVRQALEALGTGLLRHAGNRALREALSEGRLSDQDLYRQLLRVAYRLVFLFVVEDRDLLHAPDATGEAKTLYRDHYSTARLRERARGHAGGHHPDGWDQLLVLFDGLGGEKGVPALGLPSLAGGLFEGASTSDLDGTKMANRHLVSAVRSLGFTQREGLLHRVDYQHLGSEELGSIYESLLALHPAIDLTTRTFTLATGAGSERRSTGAYYTPSSLISQLLDDALDPVVAQAISGKDRADAEMAVLGLSVCDPACGSAHFLVAAAHRLAKRLATIRTGDPEPSPSDAQQALRDVVGRCIYGVDMNPMAVELAKVSLWLECHVPGQPLTFLDHHIRCGNSLLGLRHPELMSWDPNAPGGASGGIPDDAFAVLKGDDSGAVSAAKRSNLQRRDRGGRQESLSFTSSPIDELEDVSKKAGHLRVMPDASLEALEAKRDAWIALELSESLARLRLAADAWCASFTCAKTTATMKRPQHPWDVFYAAIQGQNLAADNAAVEVVNNEAQRLNFFHWFVSFPDIHKTGGFDVMLGNPPWEVLEMSEKEWFAISAPDIAQAKNASERKKLIAALYEQTEGTPDRALAAAWDKAVRDQEAARNLIKSSGRYPLTSRGRLNLYGLFADVFKAGINNDGRSGFICPAGLATGATYSAFFGELVITQTLVALYSFENEEKIFPDVHNETKFAIVVVTGRNQRVSSIIFTGYVRQAADIHDPGRRYKLTGEDIEAINPNTLTAPLFRRSRDADVTAAIHRRVPVLVREGSPPENPWGISFMQMFNMASDSGLFVSRTEASKAGGRLVGSQFVMSDGSRLVPLYEGKMIWHYDHRYGTYGGQTQKQANKGVLPHVEDEGHADPNFSILHRYWVPESLVEQALIDRWSRPWMIGFRDVGPSERTMVTTVFPSSAAGDTIPQIFTDRPTEEAAYLYAGLASLVADYAIRQKSNRMNFFVVKQAPIPPPPGTENLTPWGGEEILRFVVPRVVELSYTAFDLQGFADECQMSGPPFRWEPDRRATIQAELDALFFHLYGLDWDDAEWVLDSFTVLRGYEEKPPERGGHGEFRTKRLVLERYDAMAKAIADQQPYVTPLDVPPGDDAARHPSAT